MDTKCGKLRTFDRRFGDKFVKIKSPSMRCWALDMKKPKKRK